MASTEEISNPISISYNMASTEEISNSINCKPKVSRPLAYFPPSIWGDRFLSFSLDDEVFQTYAKEIDVLKEEVRSILVAAQKKGGEKIKLINTVERLGISYHFEKEIEELLEPIFGSLADLEDDDLCTAAISFRVFRQHGYKMSCDIFNKFTDNNGKFNENIISDVMGMLDLYEAAHIRTHGEYILDEALTFTTTHLESMATHLSPFLEKQVTHALKQPLHKGIPRVEARYYISIYEEDVSNNELLLRLAKLDFNLVQLMYKQELYQVSRWWKDLDFESKLGYTRDRIVEAYFWAMAVQFEPHYSLGRILYTKALGMLTAMDDTYDAYGTLEELTLLTDAVQRWDISALDQLPDSMKILYQTLFDFHDELQKEMTKKGASYGVTYLIESFKQLSRCFYAEAKWFNEGYVASFDEYMDIALITGSGKMLLTSSFIGMPQIASIQAFDWLVAKSKIVLAPDTIGRLRDDIVGSEREKKRGHVATGIECYMKQHGVSKEEVIDEFCTRIENAWKDVNEGLLRKPNSISKHLLMRVVDYTRFLEVTYNCGDGYTNPELVLKEYIESVIIEPIPL